MIVITGATGNLGGLIVERLLDCFPAEQIGVSVRNPDKAQSLAARGVRVRHGDFAQPGTLAHAFEGATQVLIVSSSAQAHGGDSLAQHRVAIDAAKAAGARRILYTAHMAASPTSLFMPMPIHAATERMLADCGVAWTSLRNGFYASRAMQEIGTALESGVLETPADGKASWTTHADLAEATAIILANEGRFDGPTPPLTGCEALDYGDVAAIATALGQPVHRAIISDDTLAERIVARGLPPPLIKILGSFYSASRAGEFAKVDPTLEQLLGRKPQTIRSLLVAKIGR